MYEVPLAIQLGEREATWEDFTPRMRDVLCYVARGFSNVEIADALYIEVDTVKNHLISVYAVLGLTEESSHGAKRVKAARWYWRYIGQE